MQETTIFIVVLVLLLGIVYFRVLERMNDAPTAFRVLGYDEGSQTDANAPAWAPTIGVYAKPFDLDYALRDLYDDGAYDSKFAIMSGANLESTFAASQRLDYNPYMLRFNGQLLHLAQRESADDWRTVKGGKNPIFPEAKD